MARPKKKAASVSHLLVPEEPKTEWQKVLAHLEDNLKMYVAGAIFIIICVAIAALIRVNTVMRQQEIMTSYAEAVLEESPAVRLEKLRDIRDRSGRWTAEVLYMLGETAIEAGELGEAREAFEAILAEHGDSGYAAQAMDALAFLIRNEGRLDDALAQYEALTARWPAEFAARRAHFTIGELLEELGRPEEAVAAYRRQATVFPESTVAAKAEQALDRLRESHPDLFADETAPADAGDILGETDGAQTPYLSVDMEPVSGDQE